MLQYINNPQTRAITKEFVLSKKAATADQRTGDVRVEVRYWPGECLEVRAIFDGNWLPQEQVEVHALLEIPNGTLVSYQELRKVIFKANGDILGLPVRNGWAYQERKRHEIARAQGVTVRMGTTNRKW